MSEEFDKIIQKLREPFPFEETEWKVQATNADKTRGLAVVYINSRSIQNRLDKILGPLKWQNEYMTWQDKAQLCALSIWDEVRSMWVKKCDGAENTDYEPIKGGLSDSFKRAAVMWGLGRYLYDIESLWVEIEQKGKSSIIKGSEKQKLKAHYNKFVSNITGAAPPESSGKQTSAPGKAEQPNNQSASNNAGTHKKQTDATGENSKQQDKSKYDYRIKSAAETGNSTCLKLITKDGKELTAYVKKGSPGIQSGACIRNVDMKEQTAEFGKYYMLNKYEVAA